MNKRLVALVPLSQMSEMLKKGKKTPRKRKEKKHNKRDDDDEYRNFLLSLAHVKRGKKTPEERPEKEREEEYQNFLKSLGYAVRAPADADLANYLTSKLVPFDAWWQLPDRERREQVRKLRREYIEADQQQSTQAKWLDMSTKGLDLPILKLASLLKLDVAKQNTRQLWQQIQGFGLHTTHWWPDLNDKQLRTFAEDLEEAKKNKVDLIPYPIAAIARDLGLKVKDKTYKQVLYDLNFDLHHVRKIGPAAKPFARPTHKSHDVESALQHLLSLVQSMPLTAECFGTQAYQEQQEDLTTFANIILHQQLDPRICVVETPLKLHVNKEGSLKIKSKPKSVQRCDAKTTTFALYKIYWSSDNKEHYFGQGPRLMDHVNALLIDFASKRIEIFEPYGVKPGFLEARARFMTRELPSFFHLPEFKVYSPYLTCPFDGPQTIVDASALCYDGGYCVAYSELYMNLRLLAPDARPEETVQSMTSLGKGRLLDLIRRYISWQQYKQEL